MCLRTYGMCLKDSAPCLHTALMVNLLLLMYDIVVRTSCGWLAAGLSVLLVTGVLKWKDCLNYPPAWDTLFWFAVLVGMSGQLHSHYL